MSREDLAGAIRENIAPAAADALALDLLPRKSLEVLSDLLVPSPGPEAPDEKEGQAAACHAIYSGLAAELAAEAKERGPEAARALWRKAWPAQDARLCRIIEPVEARELRELLETDYSDFVAGMQDLLWPEGAPEEDGGAEVAV